MITTTAIRSRTIRYLSPDPSPITVPSVDDSNDDDRWGKKYYPHEGNSSITTSVTIHVTPEHYHLVSWGILWSGFLIAIAIASYQVRLENKWFASRRRDVEQGQTEGEAVSTADWTRSRFRRLLLLAMVARTIMIPVQMWSTPLWAQFVADTLPEMTFASAWTLLVSFFVQLVGVALGTGTSTSPGIVIQATAYVVYTVLIATYFWNPLASVLLYALLCCIYAALFGTTLYFCPKLLTLLYPSLSRHSGLSIRLVACTFLCIFIFGYRTYGFARKVVAPPLYVSWWWQYGCLELVPAVLFLCMMHPSPNRMSNSMSNASSNSTGNNNNSNSNGKGRPQSSSVTPPSGRDGQHRRQDSHGSGRGRSSEAAPLIKPVVGTYGTNSGVPDGNT